MEFFHSLLVLFWGISQRHPNWRETRLLFLWPVRLRRVRDAPKFSVLLTFDWPRLIVLLPYELEASYLNNRALQPHNEAS